VVKTTSDATTCTAPRFPRDLAAATADGEFESILPCRNCDGCRRFDALILRRRLAEHYKGVTDELWMVVIEAPLAEHARLVARLRRERPDVFEPALYRLGDTHVALVVRGQRPALERIRALGTRHARVDPIGQRRTGHAFRLLVRGMLVERSNYGQWANRFYHRGLAKLEKEEFTVERQGGIRKRHPEARGGMRAWRRGLTLYPNTVVQGQEILSGFIARDREQVVVGRERRRVRTSKDAAHSPAQVAAIFINQPPRASAASDSSMSGFWERAAGAHAGAALATTGAGRPVTPAAVPSNPKTNSNSITGGRDAGSLTVGNAAWRATLERFSKLGQKRGP
jgi:hypothetical protein